MSLEDIRKLNKSNNIIEDEISYDKFEPQEEDLKFLEFIKQRVNKLKYKKEESK